MRPPIEKGKARSSIWLVPWWAFQRAGRIRHLASGCGAHAPVPGPWRFDQDEVDAAGQIVELGANDFGVRTWTLRAPERVSRSWIGARRRLSSSVA